MHPTEFVTVKLCVPVGNELIIKLAPLPVIAPGLIVQLPVGKPVRVTCPVGTVQVGCIIAVTEGAVGALG